MGGDGQASLRLLAKNLHARQADGVFSTAITHVSPARIRDPKTGKYAGWGERPLEVTSTVVVTLAVAAADRQSRGGHCHLASIEACLKTGVTDRQHKR